MANVYGDDFVYDFSDLSDFEDDNDDYNEADLDEIEDEEIEEEEGRVYCTCGLPNTREMIACEGKACAVEWYHYKCAGLSAETIPKKKWICRQCTGNLNIFYPSFSSPLGFLTSRRHLIGICAGVKALNYFIFIGSH